MTRGLYFTKRHVMVSIDGGWRLVHFQDYVRAGCQPPLSQLLTKEAYDRQVQAVGRRQIGFM